MSQHGHSTAGGALSDRSLGSLSGRTLTESALWSIAAQAIPAVVGVATIPFIVPGLGVERFGVLTLAWMVIGYFSLFDLGMGRAVTKFAAELMASRNRDGMNRVVWTAWYLMLALGFAGAVVLTAIVPWLVRTAVKVSPELSHETTRTFYLLAGSIPIVVLTAGFRGLLEAAQLFKLSSLVKIPMGILMFVAPLLVLRFTPSLVVIVSTLIGVRLVGAVAYVVLCHKAVHDHRKPASLDPGAARALLRFGAWASVSNFLSPLMVSVDRFFVGALLSITAVAYYATPFEAVTKLLIIPSAITAVLFPAFSAAASVDGEKMVQLFRRGVWALFLIMYPTVFAVITFAPELLRFWLGPSFAAQSADSLRWLALGVFTNSLASVPFAFIQGIGRSDATAKIHLLEAPLYLGVLVWLIRHYGITGAAIAWCGRTTLDMLLLFRYARPRLQASGTRWLRDMAILGALTPALGAGLLLQSQVQKASLVSIPLLVLAIFVGRWTAVGDRRAWIARVLGNG